MDNTIAKQMKNHSDENYFLFSVSCTVCGNTWYSRPVEFSKAGHKPETEAKATLYKALYQREMQQAADRAVQQAKERFNLCPICHGLICDNCFLICDETDMCTDCAEELGETGEPVGTEKQLTK